MGMARSIDKQNRDLQKSVSILPVNSSFHSDCSWDDGKLPALYHEFCDFEMLVISHSVIGLGPQRCPTRMGETSQLEGYFLALDFCTRLFIFDCSWVNYHAEENLELMVL